VVAYIKGKGLAADTPNMTITSFGGHQAVKGNGSVPYYMVFDHTGRLVQQHMCGEYHGGDGLAMIEWVDELLAVAPEIYLGEKPFDTHSALANKIAARKGFPGTVVDLESAQAAAEGDAELDRLANAVLRWRDAALARADALEGSAPRDVVPHLTKLAAALKGTAAAAPVIERLDAAKSSDDLARAIGIAKELDRINTRLGKLKPCKTCKRDGAKELRAGCAVCGDDNKKGVAAARKKLEALSEKAAGLRIKTAVDARLSDFR